MNKNKFKIGSMLYDPTGDNLYIVFGKEYKFDNVYWLMSCVSDFSFYHVPQKSEFHKAWLEQVEVVCL